MWDILEITKMSDQTQVKQIKDQKEKRSAGITSGYTTPAKSKRPFTEVAKSSAEEICLAKQPGRGNMFRRKSPWPKCDSINEQI